MKKLLIIIGFLLIASSCWAVSHRITTTGKLYAALEKNINGGWTLSAPVLETEITKLPLLIDFDGRMDYTMPRGGSFFNHHSCRGELHTGFKSNGFFMTFSVGTIYYIEGNSDGIPAGFEGLQTLKCGIEF